MYTSADKAADAFLTIQKFALNPAVIDRKITFRFFLDGDNFLLQGAYLGSVETFNNTVCRSLFFQRRGHKTDQSNRTDQTRTLARVVEFLAAHSQFCFR